MSQCRLSMPEVLSSAIWHVVFSVKMLRLHSKPIRSSNSTLTWDGKNDLGRYVPSPETCKVKVGLGLKPEMDKVLHVRSQPPDSMDLRLGRHDKDGVYVLNDHNGSFRNSGEARDCTRSQPAFSCSTMMEIIPKRFFRYRTTKLNPKLMRAVRWQASRHCLNQIR